MAIGPEATANTAQMISTHPCLTIILETFLLPVEPQ